MDTLVIVIHLIVVLSLIVIVLLQRSEGGALGMGGGGGSNFMSARGTANLLTRTTTILAIIFLATSMFLAIYAQQGTDRGSILDTPVAGSDPQAPPISGSGSTILEQLEQLNKPAQTDEQTPQAPISQ